MLDSSNFMKYCIGFLIFLSGTLYAQQLHVVDSLKQVLVHTESNQLKASLYSDLSWYYAPTELDSSLLFADKAIAMAQKTADNDLLADVYNSKGLAYDYSGNLAQSLVWYNKSLQIRELQKNTKKIANIYNNIGASYYAHAQYDKSLIYYLKALKFREKERDSQGMAQSFNNIGLVQRTQQNYIQAQKYYLKSLEIREALHDEKGMIYPLTNLSVLAQNLTHYSQAELYIKKALSIAQKNHFMNEIGIQKSNLGVNYLLQKEYHLAIKYLNQAKKVFLANNNEKIQAIVYYKLGESYHKLHKKILSKQALTASLQLAEKYNKLELQQQVLALLSELASENKDFPEAFLLVTQSNKLRDSIYSIEKYKALSELETKYQTEKKEEQIHLLNVTVAKDTAQRKLWLISGILGSLLLVTSLFFLYSNHKKSTKLKFALQDRETLLKEIHHRVKNNLQIVASLLNLQTRYMKDKVAIHAVEDSRNRVNSMALIHQKLYQNDSLTGIAISDYIKDLIENIFDSFALDYQQFTLDIEPMFLDVDTVIPLGLILNELIVNAIKHNEAQDLKLFVKLVKMKNQLLLQVKDNGRGLPENFNYELSNTYGMKLITSLAKKLDAKLVFENNHGLEVKIYSNDFKILN